MLISDGGGGSDTLIVHTDAMLQTGKDIEGNAVSLGGELTKHMNDFHNQYTSSSVPLCLRTILEPYATARKTELDKMVKRRQTIGELLTKASNLHELNENMQKSGFANLYQNINGYYGSGVDSADPANLQRGVSTQK